MKEESLLDGIKLKGIRQELNQLKDYANTLKQQTNEKASDLRVEMLEHIKLLSNSYNRICEEKDKLIEGLELKNMKLLKESNIPSFKLACKTYT